MSTITNCSRQWNSFYSESATTQYGHILQMTSSSHINRHRKSRHWLLTLWEKIVCSSKQSTPSLATLKTPSEESKYSLFLHTLHSEQMRSLSVSSNHYHHVLHTKLALPQENYLCHVYKCVDVFVVSLYIFILYQPFYLLFDEFLWWQEHIFQHFY